MMARINGNLRSIVAATQPRDNNRTYLYIECTSGSMTVQLDSGTAFTLNAGSNNVWEPRVVPQNAITISGTGVMVLG